MRKRNENNLASLNNMTKKGKKQFTDLGENKMGTAPIGKLLLSMAWPAVLSMIVGALYNVVDSVFVAMINQEALTAVSLILPLHMLMISIGIGSAIGVNSLISRRLGAKLQEEADQAASISIRIGFVNSVLFAIIGIFLAKPYMEYYTDDPLIFKYGNQYLTIVTVFSLFLMIEIMLEKVLQSTGNMVAPMIISISGAVTNLILDPIMIFGLLGFPRMEVAGAAIATVIGEAVALIIGIVIFIKGNHRVKIKIKGYKVNWNIVKDIYAVGLPSMVMQSIGSIMLFGYNAILSAIPTAVAVLGVYFRLQSFIFMPVFGLNQGAMPIMGYNFGAKNKERLMETYKKSLIMAFAIMAVGLLIFQLIPEILLGLFSADEEMLKIGVPALRLISLCFLPAAFGIMCSTMFQSTGHGVYSLVASVLRQLLGILPIAFLLFNYFGLEISWASFPMAELIGTVYSAIMITYLYKKEISNL